MKYTNYIFITIIIQVAPDVSNVLTNTKLNKKKTLLVQANRTKGETIADPKMTVTKKNIGNSVSWVFIFEAQ